MHALKIELVLGTVGAWRLFTYESGSMFVHKSVAKIRLESGYKQCQTDCRT